MARAASTDGHDETSSYESSSWLPTCQPGVTPLLCTALRQLNWPAAACKCFSTWLQSVASKLPGCQCHIPSHWHAAARTRTSKWRPGPAMSWPARAAPRVPRPTSDTSRQVTGKRRADNLMCIAPVKGNSSTDVLTLAVQWLSLLKVCTRLRVLILQLCIIFQIV
jgi:hypothetical protein